ncbi:MAG: LysR family transcriptional regulator [Pseudomonadota bacterium]
MDLRDLEVFVAVAEEGGVVRAADRLGRVQSAVTTRIKGLEADLGQTLFRREARGMRPTPAGDELLGYAKRLLDLAAEARVAVAGGVPRGTFRLGSMESTAAMRLAAPLTALGQRYPEIEIALTVERPETLLAQLRDGALEAAFVAGEVDGTAFESVSVFREPMALVSCAGVGAARPERFLVFGLDCPNRARLMDWYASEGISPKQIVEIGSYHAMLGSIAIGLGAGLMPEGMLETYPDRARLQARPLPEPFRYLDVRLVWRAGMHSPKIAALLDLLASDRAA